MPNDVKGDEIKGVAKARGHVRRAKPGVMPGVMPGVKPGVMPGVRLVMSHGRKLGPSPMGVVKWVAKGSKG